MITRKGLMSVAALGSLLLCCVGTPERSSAQSTGKDAAGAAIAAGVVIGVVVLFEIHKHHHTINGCVTSGPGGLQLTDVKDKRTYSLIGATDRTRPGDIVQLGGNKEKGDSTGERAFIVKKMRKDYGPCESVAEPIANVSLSCSVVDATTHRPIPGATVTAGGGTATTDGRGNCMLSNLPSDTASAIASAPGYDQQTVSVNPSAGPIHFLLQRHAEGDMARSINQTGSAALYGIQFDTNSSTLRPDSSATLSKVLAVILNRPNSQWIIAGYTDNQGKAERNQKLSEARAAAVVDWLVSHGVASNRLTSEGFGATHPVADNSTDEGRAKNRRVELELVK